MNKKIILVMGLSGSGKTTFSRKLQNFYKTDTLYLNADDIRAKHQDWDFTYDGRIRQAERMKSYIDDTSNKTIIVDMICPLVEMRKIICPNIIFYIDRIKKSKYPDTDQIFIPPSISECIDTLITLNSIDIDNEPR
jgi:adenylylsulfate kinase